MTTFRPAAGPAIASWEIDDQAAPVIATAIHDGHALRPEIARYVALDEATRLREEDPWTHLFTRVAPNRVIGLRSRFEVDLNRPREKAIYVRPEDAWGLVVWRERLPDEVLEALRAEHDQFYRRLRTVLEAIEANHAGFVVLDIHSYNHQRAGAGRPYDDPEANPEVNVGTGSLDRARWGPLVDDFVSDLRADALDVRENVRFKGGYLASFVHERFPKTGCCLAIEFKKSFMAEWTGEIDHDRVEELTEALHKTVPGLVERLGEIAARA